MRRVSILTLLLLAFTIAGCGTLVSSVQTWPAPDYFGGVAHDTQLIRDPSDSGDYPGFALIDLPMSFVLDVGFLPINVIFHVVDWIFSDDES